MLLLGEAVPMLTWGALALVFLGLLMVEPKQEAEAEPPVLDDADDLDVSPDPAVRPAE